MAIDLTFTDEQELIGRSARDFLASESTPAVVRKAEAAAEDFPAALWKKMAEMGWTGMSLPESFGGAGCNVIDLLPLYMELGRHIAPVPLLDVELAAGLVAALGSEAQKKRLLPGVASGTTIVVPAIMEPEGVYGAEGIRLAATGNALSGSKVLVPCAASAQALVVGARSAKGVSLFLVDPNAKGVTLERTPTLTGERLYAVTFDGVAGEPLGADGAGGPALDDALMRAAILQTAIAVGGGERVLEITTGYAKDRVQFGKPIGSYQAVQYLCTDIAIEVHLARLHMLQAAWRQASGQAWKREAAMAKASASKAAAILINRSHEVHAGIGFMLDYDLQLWTRRAKHWEWNLGDHRYHLERSLAEAGL